MVSLAFSILLISQWKYLFESWYGSVIVNMLVSFFFHTWLHAHFHSITYSGHISNTVYLFTLDYQCQMKLHLDLDLDWGAFEFGLMSYSLESCISRHSLLCLDLFELTTLELSKCSISVFHQRTEKWNLESFVKCQFVQYRNMPSYSNYQLISWYLYRSILLVFLIWISSQNKHHLRSRLQYLVSYLVYSAQMTYVVRAWWEGRDIRKPITQAWC